MKRHLSVIDDEEVDNFNGKTSGISTGETDNTDGLCSPREDLGRPSLTAYRPIRFGMVNVSGLAGQAHLPERIMTTHDLDFLFLSETWTAPGGCKRLCPSVIHAQEQEIRSNGRYHYGQCLIINQAKVGMDRVEVVSEDLAEDKSFVILKIDGVFFVCCYFKPNEGVGWLCEKLSLLQDQLSVDQPVVIMGDLNARHVQMGDHYSNAYGNTLFNYIETMNLQRVEPSNGRWTFLKGLNRSVIDHVISNEPATERGIGCIVHEQVYVGATEHRLVTGYINGQVPVNTTLRASPRPWNRWRLKNEDVIKAYQSFLEGSLSKCMNSLYELECADEVDISAMDTVITNWILKGLKETVGRSSGKGRKPADFLTPELICKEAIIESYQRDLHRTPFGSTDYINIWQRIERSKKALREEIHERRTELFRNFAEDLQGMEPCEQMRLMNSIKTTRCRTKGSLLKTDRTSLRDYGEFYSKQYSNSNPTTEGPRPFCEETETTMNNPFSEALIQMTLEKMPKGKATGDLGIPCEALGAAAELVAPPLLILFSAIWTTGKIPDSWKVARIQPVPKKGDLTKIHNYRPISLTEVLRRVFETILVQHLSNAISLSVEQGGFRSKRGTLDQLAVLQEWIIQSKAAGRPRFMAFLDIKAAYDQVDRELLWKKCTEQKVPVDLLKVLMALFDSNKAYLAINGSNSDTFPLTSGLLQGSPLSPILYSIFINDLIEDVSTNEKKWRRGSTLLGGRLFSCLLYADDIVLMANSIDHLKDMLEVCERHSIDNRYRFGVAKCEVVVSRPAPPFQIYEQPLKASKAFPYLGIPVEASGINWNLHIRQMGQKMIRMAWLLNSVGCNGGGFDTATCLRMFCCFLRPMVEYGLALCPVRYQRLVQDFFSKAIKIVTTSGRSTSGVCTGMFGEAHPAMVRILTLQYKFLVRSIGKGDNYAIYWAKKASYDKALKGSVFFSRLSNEFWLERERVLNTALHSGTRFESPSVYDMQDKALQSPLAKFSSCFVFRRKARGQRRKLLYFWKALNRTDQRMILNWIQNRSAGPWKVCHNCNKFPGTKTHLEYCILGWSNLIEEMDGAPSKIEQLYHCCGDAISLLGIVNLIKRMVGEYPTRPP